MTIILLEKGEGQDSYNVLNQVLEESKIKNTIILQDSFDIEKEFIQRQGNEEKETFLSNKRVSYILYFLKTLNNIENVYFYDVYNNEQVAQLLNKNPLMKSRQIYLNFDEEQNQPFISAINPRLDTPTKQEEIIETSKNEVNFLSGDFISPERFFNNQFSGILSPESSFSSFEIPAKPKGTYHNFSINSKENIHPNFFPVNFGLNEIEKNENIDKINIFNTAPFQHEPKKALIPEFQPLKNVEIRGSRKMGDLIQEEIKVFANKGELLILKDTLLSKLKETFQLRTLAEAENILMEVEAKKIVHITIRKFPNESPYCYIGLLLNVLTIESLTWVIKSIKCDLMTPTEKLILSRIKECYGLKIDPNYWKVILTSINSQNMEKHNKKLPVCPLYVKQILDPVTNLETSALYLTNEDWIPEDQGQVDENSEEWRALLVFIEDFFRDNKPNPQSFYEEREKFNRAGEFTQNSRWNNSVENILNRSSAENDRVYKVNDDVKAIPGGRYGCAQFIKYCGPENLKDLSIGKLSLLVQEAINKGILRYQRTLLVKNVMNDSTMSMSNQSDFHNEVIHSLNAERKAKLMSMVKEALLEILMENPRGISLAQIPFHLKKKLKFNVDFQELGFPKLKNFLTTLKNLVIIESVGTNHTCVKLKEPLSAQMNQGSFGARNMYQKKRLGDIDKVGLRTNQYQRVNENVLNMRNYEAQNEQMRPENEMRRITERLRVIVTTFRQGIPIQDLYRELCNQMKVMELNFLPFGCENFYQFLLRYQDQIVDISVKKNGLTVYPKPQDFWVQGKEPSALAWQKFETPGKSLRSPPGFYEGQGIYMEQKAMNPMIDPRGMGMGFEQKYKTQNQYCYPGQQIQGRNAGNSLDNSNFLNISPIIFPSNEGNEAPFTENRPNMKYTNVNVSTWNLNYNYGQDSMDQSHLSWQANPQNQRKNLQPHEESQLELQNNLRFIEELLQNDEEKGLMGSYTERSTEASLGGFYMTPNQSFSGKPFNKYRS